MAFHSLLLLLLLPVHVSAAAGQQCGCCVCTCSSFLYSYLYYSINLLDTVFDAFDAVFLFVFVVVFVFMFLFSSTSDYYSPPYSTRIVAVVRIRILICICIVLVFNYIILLLVPFSTRFMLDFWCRCAIKRKKERLTPKMVVKYLTNLFSTFLAI